MIRHLGSGIIADNLSKAGWSWGCVSGVDSNGQTIWIADAHRSDGKRFVVRADELLTAFIELEAAIRACAIVLDEQVRFLKTPHRSRSKSEVRVKKPVLGGFFLVF